MNTNICYDGSQNLFKIYSTESDDSISFNYVSDGIKISINLFVGSCVI